MNKEIPAGTYEGIVLKAMKGKVYLDKEERAAAYLDADRKFFLASIGLWGGYQLTYLDERTIPQNRIIFSNEEIHFALQSGDFVEMKEPRRKHRNPECIIDPTVKDVYAGMQFHLPANAVMLNNDGQHVPVQKGDVSFVYCCTNRGTDEYMLVRKGQKPNEGCPRFSRFTIDKERRFGVIQVVGADVIPV